MRLFSFETTGTRSRQGMMGGSKATVLYLICILALGALAGMLFVKNQATQKQAQVSIALANENETLKQQLAELEKLRAENQELQALRKDGPELLRLRGEVNTLRAVTNQLSKLQMENAQLKATLQKTQATVADANVLRNQNQQLQGALAAQQENSVRVQCMQNMRAIQAAKQAWAQDNNHPVTAIPPDAELFGPNRYMPQRPACPGGGNYNIGAVQQNPTCTAAGHQL